MTLRTLFHNDRYGGADEFHQVLVVQSNLDNEPRFNEILDVTNYFNFPILVLLN